MKMVSKRSATLRGRQANGQPLPILENGDRMSQAEFHRRYQAYPKHIKIELVGGTVYMPSPLRLEHSDYDLEITAALLQYRRATPGVHALHNATTILGEDSEPQPDLGLRILPEYAGRSSNSDDGYVQGAPELMIEVAYSSYSIDLHAKREDYRAAGALEYLVLCVEPGKLVWFDFNGRKDIAADRRGVYRSLAFPGLWIDGPALLAKDGDKVEMVLRQGLASPEHAAFVKRLEAARRRLARRNRG